MVARIIDLRKGKPAKPSPLPFPPRPSRSHRPSPLRERRRRARLAALGMVLLILAGIGYGIHALSYIAPLSIQTLRVTGQQKIDASIIESYVDSQLDDGSFHYFSRRNIFLYPKKVLESGLVASFPRVKSARLARSSLFSTELNILIEERQPFALWCRGEIDCYALDDGGYIFTSAATTTHGEFASAYIFSGDVDGEAVGKRFIPGQFPAVLALLRVFQQETNLIPSRVEVLEDQDFSVHVEQGFYVKATFGQEPETLSRNLELVLSSEALREKITEIEYVDLRFGNRVYYKMKGEEEVNI